MNAIARALPAVPLVLSLLWAVDASGQSPPDTDPHRSEARAIAEQGDAAFAAGRGDLAIPLWKSADAAFHAPTLMRCQSLLGHVVDASATLRAILDEPLGDGAPDAFVAARESAGRELPGMSERVASLRVQVGGSTAATVEIDGLASEAGATLSLDPGEHHVFVRVLGGAYEQTVSLKDGEKREVTVSVSLEQRLPTTPTQRKVGYAIGAAGAAFVLVGGVFGVLALSSASSLSTGCGADRQHCPPGDQPNIDALKNRAFAADLTLGSGLALLAVGAVIALTSTPARREAPIVRLSATIGGFALAGAF